MTSVLNGSNMTLFDPDWMDNAATHYEEDKIQLSLTDLVKLINGGITLLDDSFEGNLFAEIGKVKHELATSVINVLSLYRKILTYHQELELLDSNRTKLSKKQIENVQGLADLKHYFELLLEEVESEPDTLPQFSQNRNGIQLDMNDIKSMINDVRVKIRLSEFVNEFSEDKYRLQKGIILWIFKELQLYLEGLEFDDSSTQELQHWISNNTEDLVFTVISIIENYRMNLKANEIVSIPELPIRFKILFHDDVADKDVYVMLKLRPDLMTFQKFYNEVKIVITDYKVNLKNYQEPNDGELAKMLIYGALAKAIQYSAESIPLDKFDLLKQDYFWKNLARDYGYMRTPLPIYLTPADLLGITYQYVDFNMGNVTFKPNYDEIERVYNIIKSTVISAVKNKAIVNGRINVRRKERKK